MGPEGFDRMYARRLGIGLSVRLWKFSVGFLTVLAGSCGVALAQDFSAGKTAAQLDFACTLTSA